MWNQLFVRTGFQIAIIIKQVHGAEKGKFIYALIGKSLINTAFILSKQVSDRFR